MLETNADASCYPDYADDVSKCPGRASEILWMKIANIVLQVIYTVECILRAFVEREHYVSCLKRTTFLSSERLILYITYIIALLFFSGVF